MVQDSGRTGAISLDESQPIEGTVLTKALKLDASQASVGHRVGIANDGHWGIPVKPKTTYRLSFYAKSDGAGNGPLTASIESNDGTKVVATAQVPAITSTWQKYTATLTTGDDVTPTTETRFVISTEKPCWTSRPRSPNRLMRKTRADGGDELRVDLRRGAPGDFGHRLREVVPVGQGAGRGGLLRPRLQPDQAEVADPFVGIIHVMLAKPARRSRK